MNKKSQKHSLTPDDTSNNESQDQPLAGTSNRDLQEQPPPADGTSNELSQEQPLELYDTSNNESQEQFQPSVGASNRELQEKPQLSDGTSNRKSQEQPLIPDDSSNRESQNLFQPSAGTSNRKIQEQPPPPDGIANKKSQEQPLTPDDTLRNECQNQFQPSVSASNRELQEKPQPSDGTSNRKSQEQPRTPDNKSHNESQKQFQPPEDISNRESQEELPPPNRASNRESQEQLTPTDETSSRESQDQHTPYKELQQYQPPDVTSNKKSQERSPPPYQALSSKSQEQPPPPDDTLLSESQKRSSPPDDISCRESEQPKPLHGMQVWESQEQPITADGTLIRISQEQPQPLDGASNSKTHEQTPQQGGASYSKSEKQLLTDGTANREPHENPLPPNDTSNNKTREQTPPPDATQNSESQNEELWQHYESRNISQILVLIEEGYSPNITNVHGTTLLQACVSDKLIPYVRKLCSLVDINQKDSSGRNILFYVLTYLKGCNEQAEVFNLLIEKGADIEATDNFGRTLLHEWDPQFLCKLQVTADDQLDMSLKNFKTHIPLDKCDFKNQTPLHAAVLQQNPLKARHLLQAGSIPTILDKNNISPFTLAERNTDVYRVFSEVDPSLERKEIVFPSPHDKQNAVFSNDWSAAHRIPAALKKLFQKANLQSSIHLFQERYESSLLISEDTCFKEEFKTFGNIIPQFMKDLSDEIANEDPLFAFKPVLSGSCSEGTKVVAMDEADVLCLFTNPDWQAFSVLKHVEDNYTFIKLASDKFAEQYPKLVSKSGLSVRGVFGRFYGLIRKSLGKVLQKYNNVYIKDPHSILTSVYSISSLSLIWCGEIIQWQEFSLDVVPAIPLPEDKVPKELNHYDLLHDVFAVPKWTASLIGVPYTDEAFQLGFSFPEKDLFHAMPVALRQGYKLTKVILQKCMDIDSQPVDLFISSYMLKCQTFECFAEMPNFSEKMKTCAQQDLIDDKVQPPKDILAYADKILERLEESIKIQRQESFFLKRCNLLSHSMYKEDFRPLLYVKLCRAMLKSPSENIGPWTNLAKGVAEQLVKDENLQQESFVDEIRTLQTMGLHANWKSERGQCLLYFMIKHGLVDGVQHMVMECKAALDDIDEKGSSAVQVAKDHSQPTILKFLQESGKYTYFIHTLSAS